MTTSNSVGKGSKPRPITISKEQYQKNWDRIFKKGKPKKGESARMKAKRKSFKARHAKNIKKGKMSAAWWADKVKW